MTAVRNVLVTGTALLVAVVLVGCSADGSADGKAGDKAGNKAGAAAEVVPYEADYPSYDSVDALVKQSDVIVRGTVVGSQVRELSPEAPTGDDPVANPQAGLSPEEAAESDPVVVTVSTVKVAQVLSGAGDVKVGDTVEVSQLGGTLDGVTYQEKQTTALAEDDTQYVLMLADQGDKNPYDLLNPEQALYTVGSDDEVTPVADGGFDGIGKVDELAAKADAIDEAK
ncbi:hypothetical protein [Streptomyces sp. NBC_01483]|uniref:hypothetical protein n=1 Tax=Streptomyces sp. NBC_01483 TaxID=2903883 RepID=UPI002E320CA5|nr:hypothetical protein [Streptomyces sp. NBC_01483]